MTWTIDFDESLGMLEMTLEDLVSGEELHEVTSRAIAILREKDSILALADISRLQGSPPLTDIYELPARQYVAEGLSRNIRIALVEPVADAAIEAARFYETVCMNRGWVVQSFAARDQAIEWLRATRP